MAVPPTALEVIRKEFKQRRLSYSKSNDFVYIDAWSNVIAGAGSIGIYLPVGGEPDPLPIVANFDCVMALPSLNDNDDLMQFRTWSPGDTLVPARWGGCQPPPANPATVLQIIIAPLVAFDANCNRIGQGGGHYDRYFAAHPATKRIGIAWDVQRIDSINPQSWDMPLDAVITETNVYERDFSKCPRR